MKQLGLGVIVLAVALAACQPAPNSSGKRAIKFAPASSLPPDIQNAPATVREAYQFAIANPDLLEQFPCYCGCGSAGHTSNLDCYVKGFSSDGSPVLDMHAFG